MTAADDGGSQRGYVYRGAVLRGRAIRPRREYALILWRAFVPGSCSRRGLESEEASQLVDP
jgi:hypothetical protein